MNAIPKKLLAFVPLLILIPIFTSYVEACTCRRDPDPPCRAAGEADAVFEVEVLQKEKIELDTEPGLSRKFTMKVKTVYKGGVGRGVYVYTGDGDSDCGYRFKIGRRYLVYAYEEDGRLTTGTCTRTRPIREAKDDKNYFDQLSSMPTGARIFGSVVQREYIQGKWTEVGMPAIVLEIQGMEERTIRTDADGRFSINGLKPGPYRITAQPPLGFRVSTPSAAAYNSPPIYEGVIQDKRCLEAYFVLYREP